MIGHFCACSHDLPTISRLQRGKVVNKYGFPGERIEYIYDALF